jgi:hypothetical protein
LQTHTQNVHKQYTQKKKMKENERVGGEDENECPDLYGALNVENTATSIEVRVFFDLSFFFCIIRMCKKNSLK